MRENAVEGSQGLINFFLIVSRARVQPAAGKGYQAFRHVSRAHMFHFSLTFGRFLQD